jgi:hypothetical protein
MSDKVRVQFDFTQEAYDALSVLQQKVGTPTKAETIRYALRALQWITDETNCGARILVEKGGETQVAVFPFLRKTHATAQKTAATQSLHRSTK